MNALTALSRLAAGARPDGELLPACRLEAFGVEVYGEEAIVQVFRQAPLTISPSADVIEADGHLAVFDAGCVLFADLYGSDIARIWRLGAGEPAVSEPAIGVPFDPDLWQSRRDVALRPEDHPALSADGMAAVGEIGRRLARGVDAEDRAEVGAGDSAGNSAADYRTRPFLLRAFSRGARGAALFAVYRLGPRAERSAGFSLVGARFHLAGGKLTSYNITRDAAGEAAIEQAPWQPRVAA